MTSPGSALYPESPRAQKPQPVLWGRSDAEAGQELVQVGHSQASDGDGLPQIFIQVSGFQPLFSAPPLTLENCRRFVPITGGQLSASSGLQSHQPLLRQHAGFQSVSNFSCLNAHSSWPLLVLGNLGFFFTPFLSFK